jgi:Predicted Fe-S oxidoreductases
MASSFDGILELTRAAAVPEWVLITNATLLDEKASALIVDAGVSTVVISMDGATSGTYERIRRGADFERTRGNIMRFNEVKRRKGAEKPDLNLTFTLMRSNIDEIPGLVRLARSLDISRVNVKPLQVLLPEMREEGLRPSDAGAVTLSLNEARRAGDDLGVTVTVAPEIGAVAGPRAGR